MTGPGAGPRAFLGLLLALLALGTAFKLHGSSIGIWSAVLGPNYRSPDTGVLLGTPQAVRIDEWNLFTPAIVSQAMSRPAFAVVNPRWGAAQVPLIFKFPARHWSTLLRPQFWGFFVLDLERAFALYWNVRGVLVLGGVFLLLMLLTDGHFWVSVLGAVWAFLSGYVQWWYSNQMLPEMIGWMALGVVSAHRLALDPRRWVIGLSAVGCVVCAFNFALGLYPPYQVPLLYLGLVLVAASIGRRLAGAPAGGDLGLRLGAAAVAFAAIAGLLVLFYRDAREAVELMRATVYPGSRLFTGGDLTVAQLFSGFFGFFMTDRRIPPGWGNVCEASNFVLLFPIPAAALIWRWWRARSVPVVEWALTAYIGVVLAWMLVGWPRWLAAATGFGLTQPARSLLGVGLASILLCCLFLARSGDRREGLGRTLGIAAAVAAALLVYALHFDRATSGFPTAVEMALVVLAGGAAGWALVLRQRAVFAACLLAPLVWSYALVNPVAVGLGPLVDARLFHRITRLVAREPEARWVSYVNLNVPSFLKAAGANVLNGLNVVPPLDDLRVIDPTGTSRSVYNRYGYMDLVAPEGPGVTFVKFTDDHYAIGIDPKSDAWRRLGIRYVVLPAASADPDFLARAAVVDPLPGLWIYRYRW